MRRYCVTVNELASGRKMRREKRLVLRFMTTKYPTLVKNRRNLLWSSGLS
jgi:hypothetical protein